MTHAELVARRAPIPWAGETKIPWSSPEFSERMLREHLSQAHDRASRRFETIDRQVAWIHERVLGGRTGRILDLGCGPGFYAERLARLGHRCVGIDFSPASIRHARETAARAGLECEYRSDDLRGAELGAGFACALLLSGELNTFAPGDAVAILRGVRGALGESGVLVSEVHTEDFVRTLGARPPGWFSAPASVFADAPHLVLTESFWFERERVTVERFFVATRPDDWIPLTSTTQAYSDEAYAELFAAAGFPGLERHAALDGSGRAGKDLFVWIAQK